MLAPSLSESPTVINISWEFTNNIGIEMPLNFPFKSVVKNVTHIFVCG